MSDLALLRQVIAYARTTGWSHDTTDLSGMPRDHRWRRDGGEVNFWNACLYVNNRKLQPATVRQAVNLLVDLDVLPVEFHSAYETGRAAMLIEQANDLLGGREDPETGEELPAGVEGHPLGHRGEVQS